MPQGRRAKPQRGRIGRVWPWAVAAAALVALGVALALQDDAPPEAQPLGGARTLTPVDGFRDVHGLAFHPDDPDVLYVATHHGLLRRDADGLALVGEYRADFMGFTMHPQDADVMWASGHPPGGGNLGVVRSDDGGFTWRPIALPGVDAHAMAASPADPQVLWAAFRGEVHRSVDGGATWTSMGAAPAGLRALAGSPEGADVVHAATGRAVLRSDDAGRTWSEAAAVPANAVAIAASDPAVRYVASGLGVLKSVDGGATWEPTALATAAPVGYVAAHPRDASVVAAATYASASAPPTLHRSDDGGATWTRL